MSSLEKERNFNKEVDRLSSEVLDLLLNMKFQNNDMSIHHAHIILDEVIIKMKSATYNLLLTSIFDTSLS
jgi:hypothetical protein